MGNVSPDKYSYSLGPNYNEAVGLLLLNNQSKGKAKLHWFCKLQRFYAKHLLTSRAIIRKENI